VGDCCTPSGYAKVFGKRAARRDARRYRRRGLDDIGEKMVAFLRSRGVEGASVLEIGGGVGGIQIELLRAGAARSLNLELSPEYEETAAGLLREAGLEDRVERRLGDFVQRPDLAGEADVVVMHRVVCCYPDYDALVGAAASRARRYLVMSFPRDRLGNRIGFGLVSLLCRLLRWDYRAWIHPPEAVVAAAERRGLRVAQEGRGFVWQVAALERPA
jgi:hypothetical protein